MEKQVRQVLVDLPVEERHKTYLESQVQDGAIECCFTYADRSTITGEDVKNADVIIGNLPPALIRKAEKLEWLQHERLVHFLVTMLTAAGFLFALGVWIYTGTAAVSLLALGILVLLFFYILHYFRLENTVQHWYNIAEKLHEKEKKW